MSTASPSSRPAVIAVRRFAELRKKDVDFAGGKGANLGELTRAGLPVPGGFVIGAPAYMEFCDAQSLRARIAAALDDLEVDDTASLGEVSRQVRDMILQEPLPGWLEEEIRAAHKELVGSEVQAPVAVRSSATAEDTESASFAGMNETFLNVRGPDALMDAVRRCWASLFGGRTVFYRAKRGFAQADMDIAVVVQRQIASTRSGVMFTIDPSTGRADRIVIEGSFGLGEAVVSGSVSPDRYVVDKATSTILAREVRRKELVIEPVADGGTVTRTLSDEEAMRPVLGDAEVRRLADLAVRIERHYLAPQDTEWAFDPDGEVWMLQSRPVTSVGHAPPDEASSVASAAAQTETLVRGLGAAPGAGSGIVRIIPSLAEAARLHDGDVLVTHMTSPDWVPLMRRAAAIVTDAGGMTCHAAIVSRELGVPCVVGTAEATHKLRDGELVTVDATRGVVLRGATATAAPGEGTAAASTSQTRASVPTTGTKLLVNLSEPSQVERRCRPRGGRRGAAAGRADGARGARRHPPQAAAETGAIG